MVVLLPSLLAFSICLDGPRKLALFYVSQGGGVAESEVGLALDRLVRLCDDLVELAGPNEAKQELALDHQRQRVECPGQTGSRPGPPGGRPNAV